MDAGKRSRTGTSRFSGPGVVVACYMPYTSVTAPALPLHELVAWGLFASVIMLLFSMIVTVLLLVRLPADSFVDNPRLLAATPLGTAGRISKNFFGWFL